MESKICSYCTELKLVNCFKIMRSRKDGRCDFCTDCNEILTNLTTIKERKQFHNKCHRTRFPYVHVPEKHRMIKYGISENQYQQMLTEQENLCAICKQLMDVPRVDHCHTTLKVRGLLCANCNVGLGMFKDSIENLSSAIAYLS